jgi:maltooligosyltrehalose trehalohydrolase
MFGPYLSSEGKSSWGEHLNLDGAGSAEVRRYILENLRMWFEDFHVDGLRLDAVHALPDRSKVHILEEMALVTGQAAAASGKALFLVAESDMNDPRLITPREGDGYGIDGQWSDDYHHAVHVALTREVEGYYADFEPLAALAKVCEKGFFHDGTFSTFRGETHGSPVDTEHMPAWRLVVCNQNHDQVGNRARGDRLTERLDDDQLACAALLTLCGPYTPMLFQGEEWAATTPFAFFTSHPEADLGTAVSEGRVKEFAQMGWDLAEVPDPQAPSTFLDSKLEWSEAESGRHAVLLSVYRSLAALRRRTPALTDPDMRTISCAFDEDARWFVLRRSGGGSGGPVALVVNFGDAEASVPLGIDHEVLWATPAGASTSGPTVVLPPHAGAVVRPLL